MILLPMLAAFGVMEPDGWVEDPELAAKVLTVTNVELRGFHPPGDPGDVYAVAHSSGRFVFRDDLETLASTLTAQLESRTGATVVSRNHVLDRGRTVDEAILDLPGSRRAHVRVTFVRNRDSSEVFLGMCLGQGAMFNACETRLAWLTVPTVPDVDDGIYKRVLLGLLLGALALGALGGVTVAMLRRRQLARSPLPVDGELITISGIIRPLGPMLAAPLSGSACVIYQARARVFGREHAPRLIAEPRELEVTPFVVETARGPIRIDSTALELSLAPSAYPNHATPRQTAFLARHAIDPKSSVQYDEIVVEAGKRITLRGVVAIERDHMRSGERGYRDEVPLTTRLVAQPSRPLAVLRVW